MATRTPTYDEFRKSQGLDDSSPKNIYGEQLTRIEQKIDQLMLVLDYLVTALAEEGADEEHPLTLDGQQVGAEREEGQSLG